MSRVMRVASLLPSSLSALRTRTFRHIANCRLYESVSCLHRRLNSTQANIQDHTYRQAEIDPWDEEVKSTIARGDRDLNSADRIQEQLLADGHRVWGLVVYRCTYGDAAAWEMCLWRLHISFRRNMRFYHGLDLFAEDCFKRTVFDNAAIFDGVSTQATRQHFKNWRRHALYEEQGSSEEFEAGGPEGLVPSSFDAVWYRFCV
jgi:hypothetical protein